MNVVSLDLLNDLPAMLHRKHRMTEQRRWQLYWLEANKRQESKESEVNEHFAAFG
jgi:hypothetical protein